MVDDCNKSVYCPNLASLLSFSRQKSIDAVDESLQLGLVSAVRVRQSDHFRIGIRLQHLHRLERPQAIANHVETDAFGMLAFAVADPLRGA